MLTALWPVFSCTKKAEGTLTPSLVCKVTTNFQTTLQDAWSTKWRVQVRRKYALILMVNHQEQPVLWRLQTSNPRRIARCVSAPCSWMLDCVGPIMVIAYDHGERLISHCWEGVRRVFYSQGPVRGYAGNSDRESMLWEPCVLRTRN